MLKKFFTDEKGDTNIISIVIIMAVVVALVLLFKSYVADFITQLFN